MLSEGGTRTLEGQGEHFFFHLEPWERKPRMLRKRVHFRDREEKLSATEDLGTGEGRLGLCREELTLQA